MKSHSCSQMRFSAFAVIFLCALAATNTTPADTESDIFPLHEAASKGDTEQVRTLIANGADVNAKNEDGHTPLHLAALNGRQEVVELLIDKGANINDKDSSGMTALHWAIWKGHHDITKVLVSKGAGVDAKNMVGATPIYEASVKGDIPTVKLLLEKGAPLDIFAASALGDIESVTAFLQDNPTLADIKGPLDFIPLYCAAACGQRAVAELLIANGALIDAKCHTDATPLCAAVWLDHKATAELLIDKGANVNIQAGRLGNYSPLHIAAAKGYTDMSKLLIAQGANVNAKDKDGRTPLHLAAQGAYSGTAELLISKGADVDAKDNAGQTPLDLTEQAGHKEAADILRSYHGKNKGLDIVPKNEIPELESPLIKFLDQYICWFQIPGAVPIEPNALSEDIMAIWSDGTVLKGREAFITTTDEGLKQMRALFNSFKATPRDVRSWIHGDIGWIICQLDEEGVFKENDKKFSRIVWTTLILKKQADVWQLVHEHSSLCVSSFENHTGP